MDSKKLKRCTRRLYCRWPLIGGFLRRRAARALADDGGPGAIRALAEALSRSADERVRAVARDALERVSTQEGIDAVAAVWASTRHSVLEALVVGRGWMAERPADAFVLSALKTGKLEALARATAEAVAPLWQACGDPDPVIARRAPEAFVMLQDQGAIDETCALWARTRAAVLEDALLRRGYVAARPISLGVLTALKTEQTGLLSRLGAEAVDPLLDALADRDPSIAGAAGKVLRGLRSAEARDALCRAVIERDHPAAREIALAAGFAPRDERDRALFLFLTEQWDRYQEFDFDGRILRIVYQSAAEALRARIVEKLRRAGRTDFLTILVGKDYRSRAGEMVPDEIRFLVEMLARNKEWEKLWRLVFETPLAGSVEIVRVLGASGWRPERPDDQEMLTELLNLARGELATTVGEVSPHLPPAVRCARASAHGPVNDVAFSPHRPLIAIGTAAQRLVLWNFQRGQREQLLSGFERSIGRVAFSQNDVLFCAEGRQSGKRCRLHCWNDGEHFVEDHDDMLTDLVPAGEAQILVTCRDGRVALWDADRRRTLCERRLPFWARAARVAPRADRALLLHEGAALVALPEFEVLAAKEKRLRGSVSICAAFAPGGEQFVVGHHNGEVLVCRRDGREIRVDRHALVRYPEPVRGAELLEEPGIVITAGADGTVDFTSWSNRSPVGRLAVEGRRLTSFHVSPTGDFLAIGDSDASMSLWDLRVMHVPMLFSAAFARAKPVHLAAVRACAEHAQQWPGSLRRAFTFIERVLRHRFRYDIEIDEIQAIRPGEFDIEIE